MSKDEVIQVLGPPTERYESTEDNGENDEHFSYPNIPLDLSFFSLDSGRLSWVEFDRGASLFWKSDNIFMMDRTQILQELQDLGDEPEYEKTTYDDGAMLEEAYRFYSLDIALFFGEDRSLENVSNG